MNDRPIDRRVVLGPALARALYSGCEPMPERTDPIIRPRLLIVEANDAVRRVLTRTLQLRFEVVPLARGASALGRLREERFDILMLDLGLSDIPALELLRTARTIVPDLPVVFTSGKVDGDDASDTSEANTFYVQKPYDGAALEVALQQAVSAAKSRQAV